MKFEKCQCANAPGIFQARRAFGYYLRSFRDNFKTGLRTTLILIPAAAVLLAVHHIARWYGTRVGGFLYIRAAVAGPMVATGRHRAIHSTDSPTTSTRVDSQAHIPFSGLTP